MIPGRILVAENDGIYLIKLMGDVRLTLCTSLNDYIDRIFSRDTPTEVYVDLLEAQGVDSTTLGLLAKLALYCRKQLDDNARLLCTDRSILRILESMELDELFDILGLPEPPAMAMVDITPELVDEVAVRQRVLEAHKLLVKLNPDLMGEFTDLIASLEAEC